MYISLVVWNISRFEFIQNFIVIANNDLLKKLFGQPGNAWEYIYNDEYN